MSRSPGLLTLTRRRFATPRSAAVVIVMLTLLAAFLISAAPRALAGVVEAEVAFQIDGMSVPSRDLTATVRNVPPSFGAGSGSVAPEGWSPGAEEVFGALQERLDDIRSEASGPVQAITQAAEFVVATDAFEVTPEVLPPTSPTGLVQLIVDPSYQEHLTLVAGTWPAPWQAAVGGPLQVVLTSDAADLVVWPLGEVRSAEHGQEVQLVGLVDAKDPDADRWQHQVPSILTGTLFDDGNIRPQATGGAYMDAGSWQWATPAASDLTAWYPVDARAASAQDTDALLAGLRAVTSQSLALGDETDLRVRFSSEVTETLGTALARSHSTSATLAVAAVGPIAVSVALIVLAASLIIRRRRGDLQLLSARGTSLARLRGLLLVEGVLLGVIPAVAATVLSVLLVPTSAGALPIALAVAVGLVPALALVFVLRSQTLAGGRADLDAPARSRWVRLTELLVFLLAALAVGLLLFRGVGSATSGVDPLVVVAPMLATVALGLLAVKLHPLWLAGVLRRAQKGRNVASLIGSARSLRDPAAGSTAVLAMLVAVAIAVFSSLVLATVDRGAVSAAERAVGADLNVSGPFFTDDLLAAIAAIDGVDAVAGVMAADRSSVSTPAGRAVVQIMVTDIAALGTVQAELSEGFDPAMMTVGAVPPEVLVSTAIANSVGTGAASEPYQGVEVVGAMETIAGAPAGSSFLVMDRADFAAATGKGFFPRTVLVDLSPLADTATVSAAISDVIGGSHTVRSLGQRTEAIQESPAVSALRLALLMAIGLAVALSVVAVLLVAGVSRDARSRVIALLRTMGLSRQSGRSIVAWEFVPLGVSAVAGGLMLGVVLPLLVLLSIDLRPFTAGVRQPGLTVDPVLTLGLVAVVVIALAVAVVGGVLSARTTSLVTVLRTEEDR